MNYKEVQSWGYQLNERNGVWTRPNYQSIPYSDGDDIERSIADVVDRAQDLQLFSVELRAACLDWPSIYHLSGVRANILRPFENRLRGARVLEIGAGCGAITRYLGEINADVLALEGTLRRASIARSRTRDQTNVQVVCDRFDEFKATEKFDFITLIGVLEYAPLFQEGPDAHIALMAHACEMLKPGGQLIIAIENQLGLKYFAGAPEDHNGRVGYGVEGSYSGTEAETLGRVELQQKISVAGFKSSEFYTPFPDYKFPVSIVSEVGWSTDAFDASAFAWQAVRKDPQLPAQLAFAPERVWPVVARNGLGIELSNSFLIVASKTGVIVDRDTTLAYHYSTERRAEYCKESIFYVTPNGIRIQYRKLANAVHPASAKLRLALPDSADYVKGQLLSTQFVKTLVRDGWALKEIAELVRVYAHGLLTLSGVTSQPKLSSPVSGNLFDAVPQNIMLEDNGQWVLIDKEWVHDGELQLGYLLFRSLLLTLQGLTRVGVPANAFEYTRRGFIVAALQAAGFAADEEIIEGYAHMEAVLQSHVSGRQLSDHLNWWAGSPLVFENVFAELARTQGELTQGCQNQKVAKKELEDAEKRAAALQRSCDDLDAKKNAAEQALEELEKRAAALKRSYGDLEAENVNLNREQTQLSANIENQNALINRQDQQAKDQAIILTQYQWVHTRLQHPQILLVQTIKALMRRLRLNWIYARMFIRPRVARSGLFDTTYYLNRYKDVYLSGKDPITHYLLHGWREGRDPSPNFSSNWYLQNNFDVRLMGENPLLHYLKHGRQEGRLPISVVDMAAQVTSSRVMVAVDSTTEAILPRKPIVPYFLNLYATSVKPSDSVRVAVHVHLAHAASAALVAPWLNQLPVDYDLFVSLTHNEPVEKVKLAFQSELEKVNRVRFQLVSPDSLSLLDLCQGFGEDLITYSLVAHLQVPNPADTAALQSFEDGISLLMGSPQAVVEIWQLMKDDAALVYVGIAEPDATLQESQLNLSLLQPHSKECDFAQIDPADYMFSSSFWMHPGQLSDWVSHIRKFDRNSSADDKVIEQSILVFAQASKGRSYKLLPQSQRVGDQTWYEDQLDYSASTFTDVKVLAYYLPQFHSTPENDEWHGVGFTEWNKVASCNPLFVGHYQQHVPHKDIGYYSLNTPDHLYVQAEMMRQSGVHGMIFYHYWFGGRMILEKPAQMLLSNPDIPMPYCFCWANENWTRRWDGNESEILLGQSYSRDDAQAFIHYVLPYFRDPRYIKVGQRPVLMIYRPSSMELIDEYIKIWSCICQKAGIARPYIIATLTRGANSPQQYGMDGAVERVLHDWTDGAVPELKQKLTQYRPMNGRVLNYDAMADYYMQQKPHQDFDYFRSLVPTWDNTPRYRSEAYIVHGFSTRKFQEWMKFLVQDARQRLPGDRRFIMVNAWNEWAEGAHLEPDATVGYGYLNSIGRALSNLAFDDVKNGNEIALASADIIVNLASSVRDFFEGDPSARVRFEACLQLSAETANLKLVNDPAVAAFVLHVERPCLFGPETLTLLRQGSKRYSGFLMTANVVNDPLFIDDGKSSSPALGRCAITLIPSGPSRGRKVCHQASAFIFDVRSFDGGKVQLPRVATVLRYHASGDPGLLFNALYSLLVQAGCTVKPWIGLQDVPLEQATQLKEHICAMPWSNDCQPVFRSFDSPNRGDDLRATMLNKGLNEVASGYVGFLDYDDILYPDAYRILIKRLIASGKTATFGRVYTADVEKESGRIISRRPVYVFGQTYEHFYENNHAPLHSFLLDTRLIDVTHVQYFDDMKYMEDYFLTLQIFTPNSADWNALGANADFVGDYNHRIGPNEHTLAVSGEERQTVLQSELYQRCQARIDQLRATIRDQGYRSICVKN